MVFLYGAAVSSTAECGRDKGALPLGWPRAGIECGLYRHAHHDRQQLLRTVCGTDAVAGSALLQHDRFDPLECLAHLAALLRGELGIGDCHAPESKPDLPVASAFIIERKICFQAGLQVAAFTDR